MIYNTHHISGGLSDTHLSFVRVQNAPTSSHYLTEAFQVLGHVLGPTSTVLLLVREELLDAAVEYAL
jgi:hypothetical protein